MRNTWVLTALLLCGWLSAFQPANAQEIPTRVTDQNRAGELPFSTSVGSGIETVDLATGALNVKIPLLKAPGRGLDYEAYYHYNSNFWIMGFRIDGYGNPYFLWNLESNAGWALNQGTYDKTGARILCSGNGGGYMTSVGGYIFTDEAGGKHSLGMVSETGGTCSPPNAGSAAGPDLTAEGMWGTAASGSAYPVVKLANGTINTFQLSSNSYGQTDSNGNSIPYGPTGVDTLGRTLLNGAIGGWSYTDSNGATQNISVTWQTISVATAFPDDSGICSWASSPYIKQAPPGSTVRVITDIGLPNGQHYTIHYGDTYGEITEIDLPTGAVITYTWANLSDCQKTRRYVTSRTEKLNGVVTGTWNISLVTDHTALDPSTYTSTVTYPAVGGAQNQSKFTSYGGAVTDAKIYAGTATGTPLREYQITYQNDVDPTLGDACYDPSSSAPRTDQLVGNRPTRIVTILDDGSTQSKKEFDYETFTYTYYPNRCTTLLQNQVLNTYTTSRGNVTEIREYDWGGALIRKTDKTYLHNSNANYKTYNIVNKILQSTVYDGGSTQKAQTQYEYDSTSITSTSGTPAPQHDYTNYGSTFTYRGNATKVKKWRSTDSALVTTTYTYDDLGNIRSISDPMNHATNWTYSDSWANSYCPVPSGKNGQAYPTQMTNALTQRVQFAYFPCTGLTQARKDENDIVGGRAGTSLYDLLGRLTQKNSPDGGQITNSYVDSPPLAVTTTSRITGTLSLVSTAFQDGLGRTIQTQLTSDPDGTTYTDTTYDALGRKTTQSNPYRSTSDPTYGLTTFSYDALSRTVKVIPPDGSSSSNNVTITYSGSCSTVTDQAGKKRNSCSDGLGRLISVAEDPSPGLNYMTNYTYDTLDNLTRVDQHGGDSNPANWRTRTFTYNSLSQLLCAANPEVWIATCPASDSGYVSGTIRYVYDNDGNVSSKTSPLPNQSSSSTTVTINYGYDQLHRLTSKTYTNGDTSVGYSYDSGTDAVGQRTGMTDASGATSWTYNVPNRTVTEQRTLGTATKTITYTFNYDRSLASLLYPSGRTITYAPGGAGRPLSAIDNANGITYANGAQYAAHGALGHVLVGTGGVQGKFSFNNRLQPRHLVYSTGTLPTDQDMNTQSCPSQNIGSIMHRLHGFAAGTADNGNVVSIDDCRNTDESTVYTYDQLNRISSAQTNSTLWGESYVIDQWGSLTNINPITGKSQSENLQAAPATSQNHLPGCPYDAAGNQTGDCLGNGYVYDAENRIKTAGGVNYTYDGDGKRVKKDSGKLYWTGTGSDALSESDLAGNVTEDYIFFNGKRIARLDLPTPVVHFYFSDHLGSHDLVTDAAGTMPAQQETKLYPYGGIRASSGSDPNPYKFTGKERDTEANLDYFEARYYASSLGRFMRPDPIGGHLEDPQTLGRYAYVRNNPMTLTDPTGLDFYLQCTSTDHSGCTQVQIDPNNNKSTQWVQADKDGNATIITSDSIRSGQNTATMSENGLQVNGSQGIYFDNAASHSTDASGNDVNRNALDVAGSGDLKGFNFHVDGNCGGTCLSAGEWSSTLTYAQARETLNAHSFTLPFENVRSELGAGVHEFSTQFRFGGSMFGCAVSSCPNTPHISVPFDPSGSYPKYTVPASGGWHVDAHSGWWAHGQDIQNTH